MKSNNVDTVESVEVDKDFEHKIPCKGDGNKRRDPERIQMKRKIRKAEYDKKYKRRRI